MESSIIGNCTQVTMILLSCLIQIYRLWWVRQMLGREDARISMKIMKFKSVETNKKNKIGSRQMRWLDLVGKEAVKYGVSKWWLKIRDGWSRFGSQGTEWAAAQNILVHVLWVRLEYRVLSIGYLLGLFVWLSTYKECKEYRVLHPH